MNRAKISIFASIAAALIMVRPSVCAAQSCDLSIPAKHQVKSYYPTGFFSQSNILNPLTLVPEDQMECEAEARALGAKVDHDVSIAVIQERVSGASDQGYISYAEAQENAGYNALGNGDQAAALQHFDAAEQSLGRS